MRDATREAQSQRRAAEQTLADLFARQKLAPAAVDRDASYTAILAAMAALEEDHAHARAAAAAASHRLQRTLHRDNVGRVAGEPPLSGASALMHLGLLDFGRRWWRTCPAPWLRHSMKRSGFASAR